MSVVLENELFERVSSCMEVILNVNNCMAKYWVVRLLIVTYEANNRQYGGIDLELNMESICERSVG
jgi:hypothetical protein